MSIDIGFNTATAVYSLLIGAILACLILMATLEDEPTQSEPDQDGVERR